MLAVLIYGISTVYGIFLWRRGFREDNRICYLLLLAGMGLHWIALTKRGLSLGQCPNTNLYEATAFTGWTIAAAYLGLGLLRRFRFLGVLVAPLLLGLGVFALMPGLDTRGPTPTIPNIWTTIHASVVLLAYGAFGLSAMAALMYVKQERDLKAKKASALFALLPPIQRLELSTTRLLVAGFALLTLGLLLGFAGLWHSKHTLFVKDAKLLWSCVVWLAYAALLGLRWKHAMSPRRVAWGALGAFTFVMLTFWGFNLLSGLHNP